MKRANGHVSWREALDFVEQRRSERPGHPGSCSDCDTQISAAREYVRTLRFAASLPSEPNWAETAWQKITALAEWSALEPEVRWARAEAERLSGPAVPIEQTQSIRDRLTDAADGVLRAIRASLMADSWTDLAVDVRGMSVAAPRILVYETDDYTVSLSFQTGPDPQKVALDVLGQVTPRRGTELPTGSIATLRTGAGPDIVTSLDDFGEFRFDSLTEVPRRLLLTVGPDQIEMGPLPDLTASN